MKKSAQDTKQHILDCGYQLIAAQGFTHVGLAQILSIAEVPKGSFYHYFKSKEQFGESLIQRYFERYQEQLITVLSPAIGTGYDRIMNYWKCWIETQTNDGCSDKRCLVVKLSAEVSDLSEVMRTALMVGTNSIIQRLADCIEEGRLDGSINTHNPQLMAQTLYQLWLGASLIAKLQRSPVALEQAYLSTQTLLTTGSI